MVNALAKRAPRSSARKRSAFSRIAEGLQGILDGNYTVHTVVVPAKRDPIARLIFGGWEPKTSHPTEAQNVTRSASARPRSTSLSPNMDRASGMGRSNLGPDVGIDQIAVPSGAKTGSVVRTDAPQQQPVELRLAS